LRRGDLNRKGSLRSEPLQLGLQARQGLALLYQLRPELRDFRCLLGLGRFHRLAIGLRSREGPGEGRPFFREWVVAARRTYL
jgi:hypothetical protein